MKVSKMSTGSITTRMYFNDTLRIMGNVVSSITHSYNAVITGTSIPIHGSLCNQKGRSCRNSCVCFYWDELLWDMLGQVPSQNECKNLKCTVKH